MDAKERHPPAADEEDEARSPSAVRGDRNRAKEKILEFEEREHDICAWLAVPHELAPPDGAAPRPRLLARSRLCHSSRLALLCDPRTIELRARWRENGILEDTPYGYSVLARDMEVPSRKAALLAVVGGYARPASTGSVGRGREGARNDGWRTCGPLVWKGPMTCAGAGGRSDGIEAVLALDRRMTRCEVEAALRAAFSTDRRPVLLRANLWRDGLYHLRVEVASGDRIVPALQDADCRRSCKDEPSCVLFVDDRPCLERVFATFASALWTLWSFLPRWHGRAVDRGGREKNALTTARRSG